MTQNAVSRERAATSEPAAGQADDAADPGSLRRVVAASSLGAVFEAYDLVLYGPMAAIVAAEFFSGLDPAFEGAGLDRAVFTQQAKAFDVALAAALADAGYPARAAPELTNVSMLIALMAALSVFVAMASAPLSAWMVEMFPTRIRTTAFAMSYNIGGWFGGFLPAISFAAFTATGDLYAGLWYAAGVLLVALVVGGLFLPETRGRALDRVTLERVT